MRGRGWTGDESGAAAVEFALVFMLLVVILVGIAQFGLIFFQWLEIEHAAREGARWASMGNDDGSVDETGTVRYQVWAAAPGLDPCLDDAAIVITPANHTTANHFREPITVSVSCATPIFIPFAAQILGVSGDTYPLTASATQMIEDSGP